MAKQRLDKLILDRGLAKSRQQAQALIMAGSVMVEGVVCSKAGSGFDSGVKLSLKDLPPPYVSRGGVKLAGALKEFSLDLKGKVALDVGASSGGFSDCLLQHGVGKIYALDVGYGQLNWKLRQDERVTVIERTNIRYFKPDQLPEKVDLAVIDVSFISLTLVLPAVIELLKPGGIIIALIKPQFEVGKGEVGKGGVVRDAQKRQAVIDKIIRFARERQLEQLGLTLSCLPGPKGNREFFIAWRVEPQG